MEKSFVSSLITRHKKNYLLQSQGKKKATSKENHGSGDWASKGRHVNISFSVINVIWTFFLKLESFL